MAAMMRQKRKQILTITRFVAALFWGASLAGTGPAAAASLVTNIVTDPLTGVALEGYDPVTYFTDSEPQLGSSDFEYQWGGVPWYFVSAANRDVFMRHPEIYAPQYGGHCITSLARGFLSDGKPRLYAIVGMKLYFFYSVANRDVFFETEDAAIRQSAANWPKFAKDLSGAQTSVAEGVEAVPAAPAH